jgi:chromosome partitioning protein
MRTVVFANQKGGVAKSANACLMAHYLAQSGRRVLVLDLDHQGNLSSSLTKSGRASVSAVRAGDVLREASSEVEGGFVLVPSDASLLGLERQPDRHNAFAGNLRSFLKRVDHKFDVCLVDTNPNPDIRVVAALVSADCVLSPVQLNQEAIDGIAGLLNHERVGLRRVKARLNPKLELLGLLPSMVEPTPFQKSNFRQIVEHYASLLIRLPEGGFAFVPKRSAIAEAQACGAVLWEIKKTAARDAWREIEPAFSHLARLMLGDIVREIPNAGLVEAR